MGRDPGARCQGGAEGSGRPAARRARRGRSSEALTGVADELLALELALARRDGTAIADGLGSLIDDGFEEFGASGQRWDRRATLALIEGGPAADVTIESFSMARLGDDVVLVTYRNTECAPGGPPRRTWRSSIWVRHDERWRLRFHQASPAGEDEPGGA
jgi:ribonuclease HI